MPRTTGEIKDEVLVSLGVSTSVSFYTDDMLANWLDRATRWTAGYKKWPYTEGRVSTTFASLVTDEDDNLRGEYPEGWKPDSIRLLQIDGKRVDKLNHEDFYRFREDSPDDDERIFTDFGRIYVINPQIDVSGTVTTWGQFTPTDHDKTDPDDTTVFSDVDDINLAVVEEMLSYAKMREKKVEEARNHHETAKQMLEEHWGQIAEEQFGYHTRDRGIWSRLDVVEGGLRDDIFRRDQF